MALASDFPRGLGGSVWVHQLELRPQSGSQRHQFVLCLVMVRKFVLLMCFRVGICLILQSCKAYHLLEFPITDLPASPFSSQVLLAEHAGCVSRLLDRNLGDLKTRCLFVFKRHHPFRLKYVCPHAMCIRAQPISKSALNQNCVYKKV